MTSPPPVPRSVLVARVVDDDMDRAAVLMVTRCVASWQKAEALLARKTKLGRQVRETEQLRVRSVRGLICIIGDFFAAGNHGVQGRLDLLHPSERDMLEEDWQDFYEAELAVLCDDPAFVRSVLTSHMWPDAAAGINARHDATAVLYARYGREVPAWLWDDQLDRHGFVVTT